MSREFELERESATLSCCLLRPDLISTVAAIITPNDFGSASYRKAFAVLMDMHTSGAAIDLITVSERLASDAEARAAVRNLPTSLPSLDHVAEYAKSVKRDAVERRIEAHARGFLDGLERGEKDAGDLLRAHLEKLVLLKEENDQTSFWNRDSKIISLSGLLTRPPVPVQWLIHDLLIMGGSSMMSAKPKCGKTTTADTIAAQVAMGHPFLGRRSIKGRVLIMALEEKDSEIQNRFQRMNLPVECHSEIFFRFGPSPVDGIAWLDSVIRELKPNLVIVDPLFRLIRISDAHAYAEICKAMEPITDLARRTDTHILVNHHAGKIDRPDGDSVLGSTGFFAAVDTLLELKKRNGVHSLNSINRYGVNLPDTVLNLDPLNGLVEPGGTTEEARGAVILRDVVEVLTTSPGLTEPEIRERVGRDTAALVRVIQRAVANGSLVRDGAGKKGSPYQYCIPVSRFSSLGQTDISGPGGEPVTRFKP